MGASSRDFFDQVHDRSVALHGARVPVSGEKLVGVVAVEENLAVAASE